MNSISKLAVTEMWVGAGKLSFHYKQIVTFNRYASKVSGETHHKIDARMDFINPRPSKADHGRWMRTKKQ